MFKLKPVLCCILIFYACLTFAQPANNNCSGAITLTPNYPCSSVSGNVTGATQSQAGCTGNANDDVWYKFTATATSQTVAVQGSSSFDPVFQVFTGTCNTTSVSGTSLVCRDNSASGGLESYNLTGLTAGTTYWVRVYDYSSGTPSTPTFSICVVKPPPPTQQDCAGGLSICNNATFSGNSSGSGNYADLTSGNRGCLTNGEHQSSWYAFSPTVSGTIAFTIAPANGTDDYDFAVWGPMSSVTCPPSAAPIRCSWSSSIGSTGLRVGAGDNSEGSGGDKWVNAITANAGEIYLLVIDNYDASSSPFNLNWGLTGGASLNCNTLPVSLVDFTGEKQNDKVRLGWTTSTETNSHYFALERSVDGLSFEEIGRVDAAGTCFSTRHYSFIDQGPQPGTNYYRLRQVSLNGSAIYSNIVAFDFIRQEILLTNLRPNPTSGAVNGDFYTPAGGRLRIRVLDYMGHVLLDEARTVPPGLSPLNTSLEGYPPGIYFLQVDLNEQEYQSMHRVIRN